MLRVPDGVMTEAFAVNSPSGLASAASGQDRDGETGRPREPPSVHAPPHLTMYFLDSRQPPKAFLKLSICWLAAAWVCAVC